MKRLGAALGLTALGAVTTLIGLAWDAYLHARDPNLVHTESLFTLSNPGHLLLITGVGGLIHIYSIGYMEHDERRRRFFGYLNLFIAAMLTLVLASDYLALFVGWEGVGLASYLLIGFWQQKNTAAVAAKKAFIVNRVGDMGMALGIMRMFVAVVPPAEVVVHIGEGPVGVVDDSPDLGSGRQ